MHFSLTTACAAALLVSEVLTASAISLPNHAMFSRRTNRTERCLQRTTDSPNHPQPTSTSGQVAPPVPTPDNSGNSNSNNTGNTGGNNGNTGSGGVITIESAECGSPNATPNPTQTGGPNGDEKWLTCGLFDGGRWAPPPITTENLICLSFQDALNKPGSPFGACTDFLEYFQHWGSETGIPETLLASIALQESTCRPGAIGPSGEVGLMQITRDKCPGSLEECQDPNKNIELGARFFAGVINSTNGNLASAMGQYNGWSPGMTQDDANNHPCGQRNNLDYLQTVFNGFCQGVDPYAMGMGLYNNTVC